MIDPQPQAFLWATGIEDTFIPQARPGLRPLEEYELMGHYEHWRADLTLARDLGVRAVRWGVPWYLVEPEQGRFDWSWTDQVIPYLVEDLGLLPIIDLMHYGCPFWLPRAFDDDAYPQAVAAYAAAFAQRYSQLVHWYTPLNEPLVTALMCGRRGVWPPYLRGDRGYLRVMLQVARGIVATVEAIKAVDPAATMVHVEATGLSQSMSEELQSLAQEERHRGYLSYDLVTGQVTPAHPLYTWLLRSGVAPRALADLARRPIALDVLGLNFYPQWSSQELYVNPQGRLAYRLTDQEGTGFIDLIQNYYQRYRVPVMITETSAHQSDLARARWLTASVGAVKALRGQGIPVIGYTWFPLFTMIDWRYRFGRRPAADYRIELGLYRLDSAGQARWQPTPLVDSFQQLLADPTGAIGPLHTAVGAGTAA